MVLKMIGGIMYELDSIVVNKSEIPNETLCKKPLIVKRVRPQEGIGYDFMVWVKHIPQEGYL